MSTASDVARLVTFSAAAAQTVLEAACAANTVRDLSAVREQAHKAGVFTLCLDLTRGTLAERRDRVIERIKAAIAG